MELNEIIKKEALDIVSTYKITREATEELLKERFDKNPKLTEIVMNADSYKQVSRIKEYKNFIKQSRKEIYYSLRKYYVSENIKEPALNIKHISSEERLPYLEEFNKKLESVIGSAQSIIDIGGGIFPYYFPFERFPNLKHYVWVDKDKNAYEFLKTLHNKKLHLYNDLIGEKPWEKYLPPGVEKFDAALLIKLVTLIWRQERDQFDYLTKVPAEKILITAPKEAMTKKLDIRRREDAVLRMFIEKTGREIQGILNVGNEFGYLLR